MTLDRPDVLVLGGGPAGMSAALEAAAHGARVVLVDENDTLGGQIYRTPVVAGLPAAERGHRLRAAVHAQRDRIEVLAGWGAWGVFPGPEVALSKDQQMRRVRPGRLILAAGAYEYLPPFPGWTLPGVMTPGAAQILAKTMGVAPGRRVLVAGTGPFLLVVAEQLLRVGCEVVGVLEASPRAPWRRLPWHGWRTPGLLWEGLRLLRTLRRAGVPVHHERRVIAAHGDPDHLRQVEFAPVDADWNPEAARAERVDVDALCVAYGFVPRVFLAQQAGCELELHEELGGWIPRRDRDLRTTVSEVLAAGDGAGVAGAVVAEAEGRLAGLVAAHDSGRVHDDTFAAARRALRRSLDRIAPMRAALDRISAPRPGLVHQEHDDTVVCRCEEVTSAELQTAIDRGGIRYRSVKVMTRLGMGPCQGRFCWPAASRSIAARTGCTLQEVGPCHARPPVRPVTLGALAESARDAS